MLIGVLLGVLATVAVACCLLTIIVAAAVHVAERQIEEAWGDPAEICGDRARHAGLDAADQGALS